MKRRGLTLLQLCLPPSHRPPPPPLSLSLISSFFLSLTMDSLTFCELRLLGRLRHFTSCHTVKKKCVTKLEILVIRINGKKSFKGTKNVEFYQTKKITCSDAVVVSMVVTTDLSMKSTMAVARKTEATPRLATTITSHTSLPFGLLT